MTKTAQQFADAAAETKSVLGLLRDAHADFTQHKEHLRTAIDDLANQNIYVHGNGAVSNAAPPGAVARDSKDVHYRRMTSWTPPRAGSTGSCGRPPRPTGSSHGRCAA